MVSFWFSCSYFTHKKKIKLCKIDFIVEIMSVFAHLLIMNFKIFHRYEYGQHLSEYIKGKECSIRRLCFGFHPIVTFCRQLFFSSGFKFWAYECEIDSKVHAHIYIDQHMVSIFHNLIMSLQNAMTK